MLVQQLVELGPVAFGDFGGPGDIAIGDLQQLGQVIALEFTAGLGKRWNFAVLAAQGALYEAHRYQ